MEQFFYKYHFNQLFSDKEVLYGDIRLIQTGDLQCDANCVVSEHTQDCFEITYVMSGSGVCKTNDTEYPLKKGDINISLKGDRHTLIADKNTPMRYFFLAFELLLNHPLYATLKNFEESLSQNKKRTVTDKFNISSIFVRLFSEFVDSHPFSGILIEACINQIIPYVFLNFDLIDYSYRSTLSDKETLAYAIINYIEENVLSIKSVQDIFSRFHYSESAISHTFSKLMGKTVKRYLCDCKLAKAEELIKSNEYTITQISEMLGFSSIHAFTRAFKQKYLIPPTHYIKQNGN